MKIDEHLIFFYRFIDIQSVNSKYEIKYVHFEFSLGVGNA